MQDLKARAVRSGIAKLCGQAVSFALRVVSMAILARILDPRDFGLIAMVTAISGVYGLFLSAGLSSATVQRASITDEQVSTLFWINLLVGLILTLLLSATAPVLVAFYHEPRLLWITVALAAGFLFNAAGVQHSALLQRDMRFVALSVIEIASLVASAALAIGMALAGFGYWALVGSTIAAPAIVTAGAWLTTSWVPGRPRKGAGVGSMLRFGGTVTLNSLVVYVAYNLEKVLLGRTWGADALGIYGRANQLINLPTSALNDTVGGVAFSALSRLQGDPDRLKSYFLKGYALVMSMTLPITAFCALYADNLILVLLGPKWNDAAVLFRLMTPTVLIFGMINPLGWLLISSGLQVRSLKVALVIAPLAITAYVIGLPFGPKGVAIAFSTAMTLWLVPHIMWCVHGTTISLRDLLRAISIPFLSSVAAAGLSGVVRLSLQYRVSALAMLVVGGGVMCASYLYMLLFVFKQQSFYFGLLRGSGASELAVDDPVRVSPGA